MDPEQHERFGEAVERKKAESKAASERPGRETASGADVSGDQEDLVDSGRPQDVRSIRDKSAGKGKKTADKWNQ